MMTAFFHSYGDRRAKIDAAFAPIDNAAGLVLDRGDVLRADVTAGIDPRRGDVGGAKVVLREEVVARWLAHARGNAHHTRGGHVKKTTKKSRCLSPCDLSLPTATTPDPTAGVWSDRWCRRQSGGRRFDLDRFRCRLLSIGRDRHLTLSEERSARIGNPPSRGRAQDHALAENVKPRSSGCDALSSIGPIRTTRNQDCNVVA
jgi:hypothetical protein